MSDHPSAAVSHPKSPKPSNSSGHEDDDDDNHVDDNQPLIKRSGNSNANNNQSNVRPPDSNRYDSQLDSNSPPPTFAAFSSNWSRYPGNVPEFVLGIPTPYYNVIIVSIAFMAMFLAFNTIQRSVSEGGRGLCQVAQGSVTRTCLTGCSIQLDSIIHDFFRRFPSPS